MVKIRPILSRQRSFLFTIRTRQWINDALSLETCIVYEIEQEIIKKFINSGWWLRFLEQMKRVTHERFNGIFLHIIVRSKHVLHLLVFARTKKKPRCYCYNQTFSHAFFIKTLQS